MNPATVPLSVVTVGLGFVVVTSYSGTGTQYARYIGLFIALATIAAIASVVFGE